ncbi:MAG TPA: diacylglycerol kinase family lipid kinase [Dehalococcoidia bacterium]|nr:diacylglycerol kinase family lipid kinase [Dehalococcoidia bacterium]
MLRARLIVNPVAGAGRTRKKWPQIRDLLKSIGLNFEHDFTEAPRHAVELAKSAVQKGYETVVSVGGDGTINEVVNGLHDSGTLQDVSLGIISTGTGSDYIRTIGIPRRYEDACKRLLEPNKVLVDLGVVEYKDNGQMAERLFVNFAGLGFDAEVVRATTLKYKALGGLPAYLLGLLTTLLCYRNREITLKVDGEVVSKKVCATVMSNGKYGGGSMFVAPDADLTDGYFDVLTIGDLSKPDLLWSLPRIYKGTHLTHPKVTMQRGREVEIESSQTLLIQADGELLGEAPARFRVIPAALNVLV